MVRISTEEFRFWRCTRPCHQAIPFAIGRDTNSIHAGCRGGHVKVARPTNVLNHRIRKRRNSDFEQFFLNWTSFRIIPICQANFRFVRARDKHFTIYYHTMHTDPKQISAPCECVSLWLVLDTQIKSLLKWMFEENVIVLMMFLYVYFFSRSFTYIFFSTLFFVLSFDFHCWRILFLVD